MPEELAAFRLRFSTPSLALDDQRMDRLDQRMDRLEQRMDRFEVKLDDVAREIWAQTWKLVSLMAAVMGIVVAAVRL